MKDRNGKTLRKRDVCVVHANQDVPIPISDENHGELVEVIGFYSHGAWPVLCNKGRNVVRNPRELEIIGDVR